MSTITAISTPPGSGGIAVVRLSGPDAFEIADKVWRGVRISDARSHSAHLGRIVESDGAVLDHAVATVFRAPNSFTGEDTVEFSVHGSPWIQRRLVQLLCSVGAEPAERGEFTRRAFMNGRLDLAQAEAVADVIASSSRAAHRLALTQMSGEFSARLDGLRDRLVQLASLLELELDFSEEEVEFADRSRLIQLTDETIAYIERLTSTYEGGRAIKNGVPVAIAGVPNAGKSTLLNRLLDEEKAIVSDIPGTTRDIIEDTCEIEGILFRFYDTAGLRETEDVVESIGIERARQTIDRARIVLWLLDTTDSHQNSRLDEKEGKSGDIGTRLDDKESLGEIVIRLDDKEGLEEIGTRLDDKESPGEIGTRLDEILKEVSLRPDATHIILLTKIDLSKNSEELIARIAADSAKAIRLIGISAKTGEGIAELEKELADAARSGIDMQSEVIITNARHQAALTAGAESLRRARAGIESGLSADFIAQDIREALHHTGLVTGRITTPDLLSSVFSSFCIGK